MENDAQPEELTGPVALRICVREWEKNKDWREGGGMPGYDPDGTFGEVRVLSNDKVGIHSTAIPSLSISG